MSKNCIVYRYGDAFAKKWKMSKSKIGQSSLKFCIDAARSLRKKEQLRKFIRDSENEKLSYKRDRRSHHVVDFSCEFRGPKYVAAGGYVPDLIPVKFDMWIRKRSSWVVIFDANRKLSNLATTLLSYGTTGDCSAIEKIRWEKKDFYKLKDWLLSKSHETQGHIERINLRMTKSSDESFSFKQVVLKAGLLEKSKQFKALTDSALEISDMSFTSPALESGTQISCKIGRLGGIRTFGHGSDSDFLELVSMLEKLYPEIAKDL
ncbi:MAG: hypothetical protein ACYTE8_07860 [Planctomycetota bacterium]|jgi:hypothetical protein